MELKSIANNFFNKFSYSIEKNNRFKDFRKIVSLLVGFRNDNRSRDFEM